MRPFDQARGEAPEPSFIRELCMTLAHRWEPGHRFMLFTGFIDESDTHGSQPNVVMSAFLGSAAQWELFNRRLRKLRRDYGFAIFHATDFKSQTGEFKDWPDQKCISLVNDLTELVRDELTEGIVTWLPHALYRDEFLAKLPHKMHRASQYGVCFQATLERLTKVTLDQRGNHRLSIVLEDGHDNAGDAGRIFKERRERYRQGDASFLRTFTLASKQDSPELMACDFLAHAVAMGYRNNAVYPPGKYQDITDQEPKAGESGLTFQEVTPAYFQSWRDEFEVDKKAKADAYAARKAAWLRASGDGE
jgi:hypothetical protein